MREARIVNWSKRAQGEPVRMEAFIAGEGYLPHRHDNYAIALTVDGVQSFHYRGSERHSLPGGVVVIHPDELHDGHAGTVEGFRYRALYLEPYTLQSMLGGKALPFLEGGVSTDSRLLHAAMSLLKDCDRPLDELEYSDALYELAVTLDWLGGSSRRLPHADYRAAELAREYLHAHWDESVDLATLERIAHRDRWKLSRDFRTAFGTSPYRYLTMRRLERARQLLGAGETIADVAFHCRFADQSHLTRQFRSAFGMTPGHWIIACGK